MAVSIIQAWNENTERYESVKLDPDTKALTVLWQSTAGGPVEPTEHTVGTSAATLPVLATPNGFRVQVPDGGGKVYVRARAGVTTSGTGRGWEVLPGTSRLFYWNTTAGVSAIATSSTPILIEVQ